ncbi:Thiol:disulfide interchange protein DsbD [termite gut metagenome]|uniref:Thiol:disulfide interchange protein DsbD n=1 Tax=termite gut metagenome TaxID=433724 RepID=A0A5J4S7B2_9ZZZZ
MKLRAILFLLLAGLTFPLHSQEGKKEGVVFLENEPWETVLQKAKDQNRLIFMDCYTVWCGPCKGLAQDIFPQKKVGDYFNANFVNVSYDMEKGDGLMLYNKYKQHIIGFPTLLLINANEEVVHQMAGYKEADVLIEGMKAGASGWSLSASEEKYNAGARDLQTVTAYVNALNNAYFLDKIQPVIDDYLNTIPVDSLTNPDVWSLVGKYIKDPYSKPYRFVFDNIERKYQYRLKVNRYELETQLSSGMSDAVTEIIKTSQKTQNADTLKWLKERSEYLKQMLLQNTIKRFPTFAAKLYLNDLRLEQKPLELYNALFYIETTGVLVSEKDFVVNNYRYILENVKDKKIINAILSRLLEFHAGQKNVLSALVNNYYDVIALAYNKLGDKTKAAEAQNEYEKKKSEKGAYFKKLLSKDKEEKVKEKEESVQKIIE